MDDEWRERLREVIEADGRSLRAISKAAGVGDNYVQQMLKDEKDPTFPRLAKVLNALGTGATLYVISGLRLTPEVETFLRLALSMGNHDKERIRATIDSLRERSLSLEPLAAPVHPDKPKHPTVEKHRS